jgi:hypothetical protein
MLPMQCPLLNELTQETTDSEELHVACCVDTSLTLCSTRLADIEEVVDDGEVTCVVCADLDDTLFCPISNDMTCTYPPYPHLR